MLPLSLTATLCVDAELKLNWFGAAPIGAGWGAGVGVGLAVAVAVATGLGVALGAALGVALGAALGVEVTAGVGVGAAVRCGEGDGEGDGCGNWPLNCGGVLDVPPWPETLIENGPEHRMMAMTPPETVTLCGGPLQARSPRPTDAAPAAERLATALLLDV